MTPRQVSSVMTDRYSPPEHCGLDILHEDDACLILNKPSGLLSVPGRGADKHDCLATRVQQEYPDALIVHRLDLPTSGIMLMARGAEVQRLLSMQFQRREVQKRYIAVVDGALGGEGEIELPLITDWPNRPRQKVDHEQGKPSCTRYRVVQHYPDRQASRVELEPITGRSHQLRVHMRSLGHPILGDPLYASARVQAKAGRLLLHAQALSFQHPHSARSVTVISEPPF